MESHGVPVFFSPKARIKRLAVVEERSRGHRPVEKRLAVVLPRFKLIRLVHTRRPCVLSALRLARRNDCGDLEVDAVHLG